MIYLKLKHFMMKRLLLLAISQEKDKIVIYLFFNYIFKVELLELYLLEVLYNNYYFNYINLIDEAGVEFYVGSGLND